MAVSQIEEKILGRLASQTEDTDAYLSAALYQVLGLSILLSRRLNKARRRRRLDPTRDTKSLELYYHIIWLAREGLYITETVILRACADGAHGAEARVLAAKLRASFYHVFCLFHNHPPISQLPTRPPSSKTSPASVLSARNGNAQPVMRLSPSTGAKLTNGGGREEAGGRENGPEQSRTNKPTPFRDPIPSMISDASYITNPFAASGRGSTTPNHPGAAPQPPLPPLPPDLQQTRKSPLRPPPGLARVQIPSAQAAAAFLLPPLNFLPLAREFFETAQTLATALLTPANALRLSLTLEHAAFLWDCARLPRQSRRLARQAIREVYASTEGLDDDEFSDAAALVQALGGMVRRENEGVEGTDAPTMTTSPDSSTGKRVAPGPIDRTIALSPSNKRNRTETSPPSLSSSTTPVVPAVSTTPAISPAVPPGAQTPERLSTVLEMASAEVSRGSSPANPGAGRSRNSSRSRRDLRAGGGRRSSTASPSASSSTAGGDKATKRRAVEKAEEQVRQSRRQRSGGSGTRSHNTTASTTTTSNRGNNGYNGNGNSTSRRSSNGSGGSSTRPTTASAQQQQQDQGQNSRQPTPRQEGPPSFTNPRTMTILSPPIPPIRKSSLPPPPPPPQPTTSATTTQARASAGRSEQRPNGKRVAREAGANKKDQPGLPRPTETAAPATQSHQQQDEQQQTDDRREAILRTLEIIASISRGLHVPDAYHGGAGTRRGSWRAV